MGNEGQLLHILGTCLASSLTCCWWPSLGLQDGSHQEGPQEGLREGLQEGRQAPRNNAEGPKDARPCRFPPSFHAHEQGRSQPQLGEPTHGPGEKTVGVWPARRSTNHPRCNQPKRPTLRQPSGSYPKTSSFAPGGSTPNSRIAHPSPSSLVPHPSRLPRLALPLLVSGAGSGVLLVRR